MSRDNLARTKRLLEIRELQRKSAQGRLAQAENQAREAADAAREAEERLHAAAHSALFAGTRSLDELLDARAAFTLSKFARDAASSNEMLAQQARTAQREGLRAADLAVRQIEHLAELEVKDLGAKERFEERVLTDEVAARRAVASDLLRRG